MRLGYQGAVGSNSEIAAREIVAKRGMDDVELVPLIGSRSVVEELSSGRIDLGVVAVRNSIAGQVSETLEAIEGRSLTVLDTHTIDIHHFLYKLPEVDEADLLYVASHPQALAQTRLTRREQFPSLEEQPVADTAIAAAWLASGKLAHDVAVLCRREAGQMWGLDLIASNLEDHPGNQTTFVLLML